MLFQVFASCCGCIADNTGWRGAQFSSAARELLREADGLYAGINEVTRNAILSQARPMTTSPPPEASGSPTGVTNMFGGISLRGPEREKAVGKQVPAPTKIEEGASNGRGDKMDESC